MRLLKSAFEFVATALLMVAAVVFLWRAWSSAGMVPGRDLLPPAVQAPVQEIDDRMLLARTFGSHVFGSPDAAIVLVEFSDLQCPFCARHARDAYQSIHMGWVESGDLRYVFRHFPIESIHRSAVEAARAAQCSARQGLFWDARRLLFERQQDFGKVPWRDLLSPLTLNVEGFESCLREADDADLAADREEAERLGVTSTPTFFVGRADSGGVQLLTRIRGAVEYEVFDNVLRGLRVGHP